MRQAGLGVLRERASGAKLVDMDDKGSMTVLRDGDNGFTCVAGHVGVVADGPACMDAAAMQLEFGRDGAQAQSPPTRSPELFTNWPAIAIGVPLILGRPAELLTSGHLDG